MFLGLALGLPLLNGVLGEGRGRIRATQGTYNLTGTAATLSHPHTISAGAGSFALTGTAANLNYSGAGGAALIPGETNAFGIDFTGLTVSTQMSVVDSGTPANAGNFDPSTKLTYTSPSVKWTIRSDGLLTSTNGSTDLPYEWNSSAVAQGILIEEQRTNLALRSDDLTNASWTKSNMTTAATSTGPDGQANTATRCTATAGNATATQAITSASAARVTSMYVKRITGTGNIDMTQDNGSTWSTVTTSGSWTRVSVAAQTLTNPTVGIRIVTSGDAIDVAFFSHEVGSFITSPIRTAGATVTRAADDIKLAHTKFPFSTTAASCIANFTIGSSSPAPTVALMGTQTNGTPHIIVSGANFRFAVWGDASSNTDKAATVTGAHKVGAAFTSGDIALVVDGGTPATSADTFSPALASNTSTFIGCGFSNVINGYMKTFTYLARRATNGELQTRTT